MSCQAWLHASSLRNIKSLPPTCRVFWLDQALHLHVLRERPTDLVRHRPRGWPCMACMNMSLLGNGREVSCSKHKTHDCLCTCLHGTHVSRVKIF